MHVLQAGKTVAGQRGAQTTDASLPYFLRDLGLTAALRRQS